MLGSSGPGRAVTDFSWVRFGIINKLLEGLTGRVGFHNQSIKVNRVLDNRSKSLGRIVRDFAHVLAEDGPAGKNTDIVPVGFFIFQKGHGNGRSSAGFVHDPDGLAENFAGGGDQGPRANVRGPPRWIADEEIDGPGGIFSLGENSPRDNMDPQEEAEDDGQPKNFKLPTFHVSTSLLK